MLSISIGVWFTKWMDALCSLCLIAFSQSYLCKLIHWKNIYFHLGSIGKKTYKCFDISNALSGTYENIRQDCSIITNSLAQCISHTLSVTAQNDYVLCCLEPIMLSYNVHKVILQTKGLDFLDSHYFKFNIQLCTHPEIYPYCFPYQSWPSLKPKDRGAQSFTVFFNVALHNISKLSCVSHFLFFVFFHRP